MACASSSLATGSDLVHQGFGWPFFGNKTGCLEAIGILLPLLMRPTFFHGRHVLHFTDNIQLVYAFQHQHSHNDTEMCVLMRALAVLCAYLQIKLHIRHELRKSSPLSDLADLLSRQDSPDKFLPVPVQLVSPADLPNLFFWLQHPTLDWNLWQRLLADLQLHEIGRAHV